MVFGGERVKDEKKKCHRIREKSACADEKLMIDRVYRFQCMSFIFLNEKLLHKGCLKRIVKNVFIPFITFSTLYLKTFHSFHICT